MPPEKANCLAFVRDRSAERYFASKQNRERRSANFSSDGEKRFVEDTPSENMSNPRKAWLAQLVTRDHKNHVELFWRKKYTEEDHPSLGTQTC